MFTLKSCYKSENCVLSVSLENLSSYDLNVAVEYSNEIDRNDYLILRYMGTDGESLLEVYVVDGLIVEVGLRCYSKKVIRIDAPWTWPEAVENELSSYRIAHIESNIDVKVGGNRIDLYQDFGILVYTDAVVFMLENREVYAANLLNRDLVVLLDEKNIVIGYTVLTKDHGLLLSETYS